MADQIAPNGIYLRTDARLLDRTGERRLPLGFDGFEPVAARSVFVDKSMLVADVLDSGQAVTLFCRPRRFGKTLAMTMLKAFFELPPDGVSRAPLFEGLEVWGAHDGRYRAEQGVRPVVFFSFNDVKKPDWAIAYGALEQKIAVEYRRHSYVLEGGALDSTERASFARLMAGEASRAEVESSLRQLCLYLKKYHGRDVVVLIDEYDAPIMAGYDGGYYHEVIAFIKGWLTGAFKDGGVALDFACMTGVQRVAKESIFSDLNNVTVDTALDTASDERFGFTEHEVALLAEHLGFAHRREEVKTWYDGYRFGNADIYNPWSVLSYFAKGCRSGVYWANTASNTPIGDAVRSLNSEALSDVYSLLQPEGVLKAPLDLEMVFPEDGVGGEELWSLLYLAGYLTTDDVQDPTDDVLLRRLRIPNHEVSLIFSREVVKRFRQVAGGPRRLAGLQEALREGNVQGAQAELERILLDCVAPVDLVNENSYHMLVMGLLFGMPGYADPISNGRGGTGYFDVRLHPVKATAPTVTLEFKVAGNEASLQKTAELGLRQIAEKAYDHDAEGSRIRWGIAFWKQSAAVACEWVG